MVNTSRFKIKRCRFGAQDFRWKFEGLGVDGNHLGIRVWSGFVFHDFSVGVLGCGF